MKLNTCPNCGANLDPGERCDCETEQMPKEEAGLLANQVSITEREKQSRGKLLRLIQENPDLPVVPMVDNEIVAGDEYGRWLGSFGKAEIREYAIDEHYGDGVVRFKDEYGAEDTLIEGIAECKYDGTDEDYEKAKKEAATLWRKAIVVNIDVPE